MSRLWGSCAVLLVACSSAPPPTPAPAASDPPSAVTDVAVGDVATIAATVLDAPALTDVARPLPTMRWEDYRSLTESIDGFPTLRARPEGTEAAWFGLNLVIDQQNRSYVLMRGGGGEWVLHADEDGDGTVDVSGEGWSVGEDFARRTLGAAESAYEAAFRVLARDDGSPRLEVRASSRRTGELRVGDQLYPVELVGRGSNYTRAGAVLRVDVDRDGVFDPDPLASETFDVTNASAYVSVDGTHLRFSIREDGGEITWTPRADVAGPRAPVHIGAKAPAFPELPSLGEGDAELLPEPPYVLEFFSPGCEFCAEAAPGFASATSGLLRETGISVVSIEHGDSGEGRAYAERTGKSWLVVTDDNGTTLSELYRVDSVPTYVAVAADGTICARGNWRMLGARISAGEPCPGDGSE